VDAQRLGVGVGPATSTARYRIGFPVLQYHGLLDEVIPTAVEESLRHDSPVHMLMRDCVRVVPGLADLRIIRGYAGLRPYSRDGLPAIGPVDEHGRLHIATGHEGTGHGLAPVTGAIVAARVTGAAHRHAAAVDPRRLLS